MITIVKINPNENGSHENQNINEYNEHFIFPNGYAILSDNIDFPNFPFGDIAIENIDGIPTVTSWSPLPIPEDTAQIEKSESELNSERLSNIEDALSILLS